jgi:hypothetical protein
MDGVMVSSRDWFEELERELNDPVAIARWTAERVFLERVIFRGLQDLRPSFDSPHVKHFTAADFGAVIGRCTHHGVRLIGIEVFTPEACMLDVRIKQDRDDTNVWCRDLLTEYELRPELSFCATYQIPAEAIGQ